MYISAISLFISSMSSRNSLEFFLNSSMDFLRSSVLSVESSYEYVDVFLGGESFEEFMLNCRNSIRKI